MRRLLAVTSLGLLPGVGDLSSKSLAAAVATESIYVS